MRRMLDRRQFLKTSIMSAMWLTAGGAGPGLPKKLIAAGYPDIAIAVGKPEQATGAALDVLGGMQRFVKPGDKVLIKPNMSFPGGVLSATTTNPEVVREVVTMCKRSGASSIRVLDHPLRRDELCIEGVREACRIFNDDMVHGLYKKDFFKAVSIPDAEQLKETRVMRDYLDSDVLIAVPVAKTHGSTGVSLSMKGMMGLVLNRSVMHWKYDLSTSIVDLCTLLKPALVIIDASRVLSTNGPGGPGKVLDMNTIIASTDMVAADAQAVRMFEWYGRRMQPRQVKHIELAHQRGLGRMDIENLMVKRVQV